MYLLRNLPGLCLILLPLFSVSGQDIAGRWKTIDDETGKERSIVEISQANGVYSGKVIRLFRDPGEDPDPVCDACDPEDDRYQKKVVGMQIIRGMKKSGEEYTSGTILDPKNGKVYRCKLWVEDGDLMVRGYWGPFFRTQTWKKDR